MKITAVIKDIDLELLNHQKMTLLHLADSVESELIKEELEGVISMIDVIQDYAADELGISEDQIFNFKEDEV